MPQYYQSPRQTGRTTRMVQYAIKKAKEGQTVLILVASLEEQYRMIDIVRRLGGTETLNAGRLAVMSAGKVSMIQVHQGVQPIPGKHFHQVLIDHYAIEENLGGILNEWHRWNEEIPEELRDPPDVPEANFKVDLSESFIDWEVKDEKDKSSDS